MLQVFVYGTLKPREKYYPIYCQGKTVAEVRCWTRGKLFALPIGYPAMILGNDKVFGYLLSFASKNELANLDELEGYSGEVNSPSNEYDRFRITVYDDNNTPVDQAWAYFMTEKRVQQLNGVYLPSGWWDVNSW